MAIEFELSEVAGVLSLALHDVDWNRDRVVRSYDEASDTFIVHFFGRGLSTYSAPVHDGEQDAFMLLVEFGTERIVGVQFEDFLRAFVPEHPQAARWLSGAEWRSDPRRGKKSGTDQASDGPLDRVVDELSGEIVGSAAD